MRTPSRTAVISADGKYRYLLSRQVGPSFKVATFVMLNPSTADAAQDDATIRKCMGFARRWGCGLLQVVNLFAIRSTDPAGIRGAVDPVGPENAVYLRRAVKLLLLPRSQGTIVCAWGTHGGFKDQDLVVLKLLDRCKIIPLALGVTRDGHPRHPLYVPYAAPLLPFVGRQA